VAAGRLEPVDLHWRRWSGAVRRLRHDVEHLFDSRPVSGLQSPVVLDVVSSVRRLVAPRGLVPGRVKKPAKPLTGQIAVVAGATRGAGRGIARALGEAGATVYCTGRSVRGNPSPYSRPETIEETAELIAAAGGTAIPIRVDHTVESEVEALFQRIDREHGRLDILVNSIAGEEPMMTAQRNWFWTVNLEHADTVFRQALVSHIITAKHGAMLMMRQGRGLIVEVTENDILSAGGNPMTQSVKLALKGLALNMAAELKPHGVAAIAISPGFLRSEAMLEHFGITEANWRDGGKKDKNFLESESPMFVGRAVAALAQDRRVLERSGQLYGSWELGRVYRFTDADGRRPDWGASKIDFSRFPPSFLEYFRNGSQIQLRWLKALMARTKRFTARLPPKTAQAPARAKRRTPRRSASRKSR
jgi:NAD(P)-dependent dehydrogenase (short-subunit alcohol dehydrogenase family)